ncbi:hypothetical protein SPHINGOT1_200050 [Sphingomonas sp. T1]|nr:hypothetical protein SPHINGOT1_200050 [Sphingomonas sp. T1]
MHAGAIASAGGAGNWFFGGDRKEGFVHAEARRRGGAEVLRLSRSDLHIRNGGTGRGSPDRQAGYDISAPPRLRANKSSLPRPRG